VAAHADLLQYTSAAESVLNPHSPGSTMPAYSRVDMIHAAAVGQRKNLMEFPNSRGELQLNKNQLLKLALRIMPMHCFLQPGLPETAVEATAQGIFCTTMTGIYFIFIFIFMIYYLVLTQRISQKGCMDDISYRHYSYLFYIHIFFVYAFINVNVFKLLCFVIAPSVSLIFFSCLRSH